MVERKYEPGELVFAKTALTNNVMFWNGNTALVNHNSAILIPEKTVLLVLKRYDDDFIAIKSDYDVLYNEKVWSVKKDCLMDIPEVEYKNLPILL